MTQPDNTFPEKSANYDSLSAFAAKTETDWKDGLSAAEENRWGSGGLLGALFEGLADGKPFVVALFEAVVNQIFEGLSAVFDTVTNVFEGLASNFSGKWRDIISAKDAAAFANAQLAVMNRAISDLFDGAAGALSGSWSISSYDIGGGSIEQDGRGNAWWDGFGGLGRGQWARWDPVVTVTDLQIVSTVMPLRVQDPLLGSDSYTYLLGRVVETGVPSTFVYAQIGNNTAEVGCFVSGTQHVWQRLSTATQDGDKWDFYVGTIASDRQYILRRNGVTLIDWPESGTTSYIGAGYRAVGFGMFAGNRLGFLAQTSPGTMAMFSADDQ